MNRIFILIILVFSLLGCTDQNTEMIINIYSDLTAPDEMDKIELRLYRAGMEFFSKEYQVGTEDSMPIRILISQENNVEELLGIVVRGRKGDALRAEVSCEKSFIKGKRVEVDIYLKKKFSNMDGGFEFEDAGVEIGSDTFEVDDILSDAGTSTDVLIDEIYEVGEDVGCIGASCGANAQCINGQCVCNNGFENCDGKLDNGCEGDILNDFRYCGGCKSDCNPLNVDKPLCNNGECDYGSCSIMYQDKDLNKKNGCESFNYFPKVYGGKSDELLEDMLVTKNGEIMVLATTKSCCFGDTDLWLLRLDKNGAVIWQKVIGREKEIKSPLKMIELEDEGILIVGSTNGFNVKEAAGLILKIDSSGNITKSSIMDNGDWVRFYEVDCDNFMDCKILGTVSMGGIIGLDIYELSIDKDFKIKSQRLFKIEEDQLDGMDLLPNAMISNNENGSGEKSIVLIGLNSDDSVAYTKRLKSINGLNLQRCIQLDSAGIYCSVTINLDGGDIVIFRFDFGNGGKIVWKRALGEKEMDFGWLSDSSDFLNKYLAGTSIKDNLFRAFILSFDNDGVINYSKYYYSQLGDGALYSNKYDNQIILVGGVSLSYGSGGMDLLLNALSVNGEFISECHFEEEGDIEFTYYEPDITVEDIQIDEIVNPDFILKDVEFNTSSSMEYGAGSICEK